MRERFHAAVTAFVERHAVPVVPFESGQDKDAIATAPGRAHFVRLPRLTHLRVNSHGMTRAARAAFAAAVDVDIEA